MSDPKQIRVFYEDDDDRVVLEELRKHRLLPDRLDIARRSKDSGGKDQMVKELVAFVSPDKVGGSAIALRDYDHLTPAQVGKWLVQSLATRLQDPTISVEMEESAGPKSQVRLIKLAHGARSSRVAIIPVGRPDDSQLKKEFEIDRFMVDDYILALACNPDVYGGVSEFKDVPHDKAMKKLSATVQLLQDNEIAVRDSKRLLHLLRGIAGFRASPAEFARRLMTEAVAIPGTAMLNQTFHPLIDDLEQATRLLGPST